MEMTRVVLADDHDVVRAGIRHLLRKAPDIQVVGEARDGNEAIQMVEQLEPDVLVLDMEMPAVNGVEVAQQLHEEGSQVKILVLSAHEDRHFILEVLDTGVSGYLTKDEVPETVIEAVRGVSRGEEGWVSPRIAAKIAIWLRNFPHPARDLNPSEREVLRLISQDLTNAEISTTLGITERLVERHIESAQAKLGVVTRSEAVLIAKQEGII